MDVLIFGTGRWYGRFKKMNEKISIHDNWIGFVDNRVEDVAEFDGRPIYNPRKIDTLKYDYIVLMSYYSKAMREQLLSLGVDKDKILYAEEYLVRCTKEKRQLVQTEKKRGKNKKRIILFANDICLDGSSMAIVSAALELSARHYDVTLSCSCIEGSLHNRLLDGGVSLIIIPGIRFLPLDEMDYVKDYDVALVNVFPNIRLACEISKKIPVLWWVHEAGDKYSDDYEITRYVFQTYDSIEAMQHLRIAAVSSWAAQVFETHYPCRIDTVFPVGLMDEAKLSGGVCSPRQQVIRFCLIGEVSELKGQDVFLEAISMLEDSLRRRAEFCLIGSCDKTSDFGKDIMEKAERYGEVKLLGIMDRSSLRKMLQKTDVVVCASREETLSLAIVEGMMHGKICVTTDATGIAEVMRNGEDGFVVTAGDAEELAEVMRKILAGGDMWNYMRKNARAVYQRYFSVEKMGDALERELQIAMSKWKKTFQPCKM